MESANGDIRSAIMALQFACIVEVPGPEQKGRAKGTTKVKEAKRSQDESRDSDFSIF